MSSADVDINGSGLCCESSGGLCVWSWYGGIKDGRTFKGWVEFHGKSQDDIPPFSLQSGHEVV